MSSELGWWTGEGATVIDYPDGKSTVDALRDPTGGVGPDSCVDAVGMEAQGTDVLALYGTHVT